MSGTESGFDDDEEFAEAVCPKCGLINPAAARFCDECGAPIGDDVSEAEARRAAARGRGRATGELAKAMRVVNGVRGITLASAIISAVVFLLSLLGYFALRKQELDSPEVLVLLVIQGVQVALMVTAFLRVRRDPFFWVVVTASYMTLLCALTLLQGGFPILLLLWTVALWAGVPATVGVQRILQEHPELRLARKMRGETPGRGRAAAATREEAGPGGQRERGRAPVEAGETVRRMKDRDRRQSKAAWRSRGLLGAVGGMLLAFIVVFAMIHGKPPDLQPTLDSFADAVRTGDPDAIHDMFPADRADRMTTSLRGMFERRDWLEVPPVVAGMKEIYRQSKAARIDFILEGETDPLETRWNFNGEKWMLTGLKPPPQ